MSPGQDITSPRLVRKRSDFDNFTQLQLQACQKSSAFVDILVCFETTRFKIGKAIHLYSSRAEYAFSFCSYLHTEKPFCSPRKFE